MAQKPTIKETKSKVELTWRETINKYTLGLPLLIMYKQDNLEFF